MREKILVIEDDPKILDLAAQAGAWYVYQAVFDTSDFIRERIRRYHDYGIGVEGTILLGMDNQSEDDMRRLIDFLLEIDLDLAEFTILTPYPHTKAYEDLMRKYEQEYEPEKPKGFFARLIGK